MTLNDLTISLDLAKRLKALGVPQESYFSWQKNYFGAGYHLEKSQEKNYDDYSAFTETEICRWLPNKIEAIGFFSILKFNTYWVGYGERTKKYIHFDHKNPAEAKGLMLEYLLNKGLLKVEDLKI